MSYGKLRQGMLVREFVKASEESLVDRDLTADERKVLKSLITEAKSQSIFSTLEIQQEEGKYGLVWKPPIVKG